MTRRVRCRSATRWDRVGQFGFVWLVFSVLTLPRLVFDAVPGAHAESYAEQRGHPASSGSVMPPSRIATAPLDSMAGPSAAATASLPMPREKRARIRTNTGGDPIRGKDRTVRKARTCPLCRAKNSDHATTCKGRTGRGVCEYFETADGVIVARSM